MSPRSGLIPQLSRELRRVFCYNFKNLQKLCNSLWRVEYSGIINPIGKGEIMWEKIQAFFSGRGDSRNNGKLILVIDDGEVERKFMAATLERKGYTVLTAASGDEGIRLAQERKPDAIFLDFIMPPGLNGKEVCTKLKSDEKTRDIPVVFLSGSVTPGKVIDCYDVGAEYYLSKPISAATLLEHTRLLIEDAEFGKKQTAQAQE